jgi:hypothetical protein
VAGSHAAIVQLLERHLSQGAEAPASSDQPSGGPQSSARGSSTGEHP